MSTTLENVLSTKNSKQVGTRKDILSINFKMVIFKYFSLHVYSIAIESQTTKPYFKLGSTEVKQSDFIEKPKTIKFRSDDCCEKF